MQYLQLIIVPSSFVWSVLFFTNFNRAGHADRHRSAGVLQRSHCGGNVSGHLKGKLKRTPKNHLHRFDKVCAVPRYTGRRIPPTHFVEDERKKDRLPV